MNSFDNKAKFIAFLDNARWSSGENYDTINFSHNDLSYDEKLLTHWLCYISDRQMGYKQIWDVGGFVYSDLVKKFTEGNRSVKSLLEIEGENSFFVKNEDKRKVDNQGNEIPAFIFKSQESVNNSNIITERYSNYIISNKVKFTPRYYPSDYLSIYYTLYVLTEFNFSFTDYISSIINQALKSCKKDSNKVQTIMQCLFCGLYALSYSNIGQSKSNNLSKYFYIKEDIRDMTLLNLCRDPSERLKKIKSWLDVSNQNFITQAEEVYKKKRFTSKRIWCCIRDYFIHTRDDGTGFRNLFEKALGGKIEYEAYNILFNQKEILSFLELPGDVWNNNSIFRKCLFSNEPEYVKGSFNKKLRELFKNNKEWYPEQFDVTFSFVPRMCEQNKCKYCPMCIEPDEKDFQVNFEKLCSGIVGSFCPAVLMYTGYIYKCPGQDNCNLYRLIYKLRD